jgi:hypothetical protein
LPCDLDEFSAFCDDNDALISDKDISTSEILFC